MSADIKVNHDYESWVQELKFAVEELTDTLREWKDDMSPEQGGVLPGWAPPAKE
jgi:hypothetical protein